MRDQGPLVGTATEAVEHCHIDDAKVPWRLSNRKNFFPQLRDYITRRDALNLFDNYIEYRFTPSSLDSVIANFHPLQQVQSIHQHLRSLSIAPVLAKRPKQVSHIINIGPSVPHLPELVSSLYWYFSTGPPNIGNVIGNWQREYQMNHLPVTYQTLDLWTQFKIM